ncbi:unnamed protein product [marine sediment metagenome]|uniref:Uncharacterized protein n=1 Tax=marine sediment metagenome TaxID=412755 RepID=X1SRE2_9ZZZZ
MRTNPNSILPSKSLPSRDNTRPGVADVGVLSSKYLTLTNRDKSRIVRSNLKVPSKPDESDDYEFDEDEFKDLDDDEA